MSRATRIARQPWRGAAAIALALALAGVLLAACDQRTAPVVAPPPVEIGSDASFEAIGYYCGMALAEHPGPKGQIHLASRAQPLWFSSVRDTIAFTRLPEEPRDIVAVYVNDMARAGNWDQPEAGTWVEAGAAWYVTGSDRRGGMGAQEAIPFSEERVAREFQARHGGEVVRLEQIPDLYVLGPVELAPPASPAADGPGAPHHGADSSHP